MRFGAAWSESVVPFGHFAHEELISPEQADTLIEWRETMP